MGVFANTFNAIANAIKAKDGGGDMTPAQMAGRIAALPVEEEWTPPSDWPNLRTLLANDTETGYTNKTYILHYAPAFPTVTYNAPKWVTSDGGVYYGNATHTWGSGVGNYGWVALYTNDSTLSLDRSKFSSNSIIWVVNSGGLQLPDIMSQFIISLESDNLYINQNTINKFWQCSNIQYISPIKNLSLSNCQSAFNGCFLLKSIDGDLNLTGNLTCRHMFLTCYLLTRIPDTLDLSSCTDCYQMFQQCRSLKKIPDILDLSSCTSCYYMFSYCNSIKEIKNLVSTSLNTNAQGMFERCYNLVSIPNVLDFRNVTTAFEIFHSCYSLQYVPEEMRFEKCTTCNKMFYDCRSLKKLPSVLDCRSATSIPDVFFNCFSIKELPLHMTVNLSVSFAQSTQLTKNTVATFDSNGVVNGGFVYGLDSYANGAYQSACPNSGQTITFSQATRNLFTATEWTAVKTALTAKNWGVSPAS